MKPKSLHDLDKISPWYVDLAFWRRWKKRVSGQDLEYMQNVSEALLAQSTPASSAFLYLVLLLTGVAIVWASTSKVDEVTQAEARVITSNRDQVVNSLEGGLLAAMLVSEGDTVIKGQAIVQLEPTRFESQYEEGISKQIALKAALSRARSEALNQPLSFPAEVLAKRAIVDNETRTYQAKKKMMDESVAALRKSVEMISNEIQISQKLSEQGLFSIVELSRLRRQENDLNQQITERLNKFRADANAEVVRIETELSQLKPNLNARRDTYDRTTLRAPVNGIVKNIRMTTLGAAVPGGAPILDIVPVDAKLLLDARLDPKDISYIKQGLPVTIKMAAFDTAIYGELKGTVVLISPDTFRGEDARNAEGQPMAYYRVLIESEIDKTDPRQKNMVIIPGMTATAQIKTGAKTVMEYLIKPIYKAKEAFRER
jgi:membrane fusion protein, adhesin transport system